RVPEKTGEPIIHHDDSLFPSFGHNHCDGRTSYQFPTALLALSKRFFGTVPICDVPNDDGKQFMVAGLQLRNRSFNWKLVTICSESPQCPWRAWRAFGHAGLSEVANMFCMGSAETLRDEAVDRASDRVR